MDELSRHIEALLLENDCVIVPEFGGFIAHRRPAFFDEGKGMFYPPSRTIGFNPQLVMNDGLLVQSYMQAYNTDFPDATRKIERTVKQMKEILYSQSCVLLKNVGTVCYNVNGEYEFEPDENAFLTPYLYGLQPFSMEKLPEQPAVSQTMLPVETVVPMRKRHSLRHRTWIKNTVSIAAAIILFFVLSVPVENTYVDDAEYASLGTVGLFETIRNQSMVSTALQGETPQVKEKKQTTVRETRPKKKITPVAVRVEKVASPTEARAKKTETPAQAVKTPPTAPRNNQKPIVKSGKYHIIVASLDNATDAKREVERLQAKGYAGARVIESDKRFRISVGDFDTQAAAYKKTNEIRKTAGMESAWVCTSK